MIIREETPEDFITIDRLLETAFGQRDEADLVAALRHDGAAVLSLVAEDDAGLHGHVLFSKLAAPANCLALGPLAVRPERQSRGIGTRLIENGLARATEQGWGAVFLLGDPAYYRRFGLSVAAAADFETHYPAAYFMALALRPDGLAEAGPVIFAAPFRALD